MVNLVISTIELSIVSNTETSIDSLDPCSHQEADTRIFVYARHATVNGSSTLITNANDTYIVIASIVIATIAWPNQQNSGD